MDIMDHLLAAVDGNDRSAAFCVFGGSQHFISENNVRRAIFCFYMPIKENSDGCLI